MRKRAAAPTRAGRNERFNGIAAAAKAFSDFRPASSVLSVVRAVPTRFVQFDHATHVGGLPLERFMLLHGPSGEGKTILSLGLLDSFLKLDHMGMLIDAERTTPITWARGMMGETADHPGFFALRPKSYEETVGAVRKFVLTLKAQRDKGVIAPDTSALIVCDSIRKLVPEGLFAKIVKEFDGKGRSRDKGKGIDGAGGRAAQIKAAMNSQWMDDLVPLLEETKTAFLCIARETDDGEADKWAKMAGRDFKVGGGKALYYDASLVIRADRASWVQEKGEGESDKVRVYGERHRVTIIKTKVSGHEEKQTQCYFHTSNGVLTPVGFDRARDVFDLAVKFGVIEQKGAWFSTADQRVGQGAHNAVKKLSQEPELLAAVERAVRSQFADNAPVEFDSDGVVQ